MAGVQQQLRDLEAKIQELADTVESHRKSVNEINENVIRLVNGLRDTGFVIEDLKTRVTVLETP